MPRNPVHDQLVNCDRQETAIATFHLLDTLQAFHHNRGIQINAAILLAALLCDHLKVDLQDAMTAGKNLLNSHDDKLATEFEAIRWYMREEIK